MQRKMLPKALLALLIAFSCFACSNPARVDHAEAPIESLDETTPDLAKVAADALALAAQEGPRNVLVVFDIDNTLLAMEQGLGADQWYDWQKSLANEDPCNPRNVGDRFAVQGALYFASAMRPTQRDAAQQVATIQDSGMPVIALTSRGHDYRLQTFRELRRNGYSFADSGIGPRGGYAEPFIPVEGGRLSRYEDGVFLTAGQHKGEMLNALLQKAEFGLPAAVVMVDDKQKNLDAVVETFSALGVPVRAWRYSGEDANVTAFDPEKAHAGWLALQDALRKIQEVLGPDNYDLTSAQLPEECP
jgi:hypothetical protein